MSATRRVLLSLLPKVALSRTTGLVTRTPLPRRARSAVFRWFARRYGADLDEVAGELTDFRSLASFFQRPLRSGSRPIADGPLVWPCDGRVVTTGAVQGGRIPQIKDVDYAVGDLLGDATGATAFHAGSQATVYLAPGDYHRVHAPFDATVMATRTLPGTLFPVNAGAVGLIDGLFVRNARIVFDCTLTDGRPGAVVMVGALNVGDLHRSIEPGAAIVRGDEIGRFGFGSTTVVLVGAGEPQFAVAPPQTVVRMGGAAPLA